MQQSQVLDICSVWVSFEAMDESWFIWPVRSALCAQCMSVIFIIIKCACSQSAAAFTTEQVTQKVVRLQLYGCVSLR